MHKTYSGISSISIVLKSLDEKSSNESKHCSGEKTTTTNTLCVPSQSRMVFFMCLINEIVRA